MFLIYQKKKEIKFYITLKVFEVLEFKEQLMRTGLIQLYTGNGKGKTTAAIGLAIRALGAGLKVAFFQFLKGGRFSVAEEKILKSLSGIDFIRFKQTTPLFDKIVTVKSLKMLVKSDLKIVASCIANSKYDLIILDELTHLIDLNIIEEKVILNILNLKSKNLEIVITGRNASKALLKKADLVTEMKEIKHPYTKGIKARKGIDY